MSGSWKVTLPCTRAEAEAIDDGDGPDLDLDPMPTLTTTEAVVDSFIIVLIANFFFTFLLNAIL